MHTKEQDRSLGNLKQMHIFYALLANAPKNTDPILIAKISKSAAAAVVHFARTKPDWWIFKYAKKDKDFFYHVVADKEIILKLKSYHIQKLAKLWFKDVLVDKKLSFVKLFIKHHAKIYSYNQRDSFSALSYYENELKTDSNYNKIGEILWSKQKLNNNLLLASDNVEQTNKLLKEGADPNGVFYDKEQTIDQVETPFTYAVAKRPCQLAVIKLMLQFGADQQFNPTKKESPIIIALESENSALTKILLEYGAQYHNNYEVNQVLNRKEKLGGAEILKTEINKFHSIVKNFVAAIKTNNQAEIKLILEQYPAALEYPLRHHYEGIVTPVAYAILTKSQAYKFLLTCGAKINKSSSNSNSLLHFAVQAEFIDAVKYLVAKEIVDIDAYNRNKKTAMGIALDNRINAAMEIIDNKTNVPGYKDLYIWFRIIGENKMLEFLPYCYKDSRYFNDKNRFLDAAIYNKYYRVVAEILNRDEYINLNSIGIYLSQLPNNLAKQLVAKRKPYQQQTKPYNDSDMAQAILNLLLEKKFELAAFIIEHTSTNELDTVSYNRKSKTVLSLAIKFGNANITKQLLDRESTITTYKRNKSENKRIKDTCGLYKKSITGFSSVDLMLIKRGANYKAEITKNLLKFKHFTATLLTLSIATALAAFGVSIYLGIAFSEASLPTIAFVCIIPLAGISFSAMAGLTCLAILSCRLLAAFYAKHFYQEPQNYNYANKSEKQNIIDNQKCIIRTNLSALSQDSNAHLSSTNSEELKFCLKN